MNTVVLATAGYDHKIRFWEPPSGLCTRTLRFVDSQVNCLRITPDKHFLAAAGNPLIRLFEINSSNPNPYISFEGHSHNVMEVGFHREGKWLYSGGEDGTIKIWDLRTPNCQMTHEVKSSVNTVQLHPNQGEIISGDQDGMVISWDLTADKAMQISSQKKDNPVRSLSIASDASMLAVGNNQADVTIYGLDSSGKFEQTKSFNAHDGYLLKCVLSPDTSVLVTTSSDKTAKVWDATSGEWALQQTLSQHQRWVWDAVFFCRFFISCYCFIRSHSQVI
mmetsp:Transcript_16050/g.21210  ORF Transcript_16050/g.21210 Transcript_16050/m.21210 type:complete len:277 (+) Transcript_16050:103-933(+)